MYATDWPKSFSLPFFAFGFFLNFYQNLSWNTKCFIIFSIDYATIDVFLVEISDMVQNVWYWLIFIWFSFSVLCITVWIEIQNNFLLLSVGKYKLLAVYVNVNFRHDFRIKSTIIDSNNENAFLYRKYGWCYQNTISISHAGWH